MFTALAYVHGQLLRLCLWLLRLPLKAIWSTLAAMLALLGEETRRWLGLGVGGLLIFLAGRATLSFAPDGVKRPLVLTILVMVVIWALAVRRAFHHTAHNNLLRVRQRQAFRQLSTDVNRIGNRLGGRVMEGAAARTRGTPLGRVFGSNRAADAQAEADARAATEQAEAETKEAAQQAEVQRQAAEAEERRLDELYAKGISPL